MGQPGCATGISPGKGLNTGEERQHATGDPCALLPGNIPFQTGDPMPDISGAVSEERQGVVISIEVTAGAKEAGFPAGYNEWRRSIGCRVTAPALEGRANKAIIELVAETSGRSGILGQYPVRCNIVPETGAGCMWYQQAAGYSRPVTDRIHQVSVHESDIRLHVRSFM